MRVHFSNTVFFVGTGNTAVCPS